MVYNDASSIISLYSSISIKGNIGLRITELGILYSLRSFNVSILSPNDEAKGSNSLIIDLFVIETLILINPLFLLIKLEFIELIFSNILLVIIDFVE